jgi:hypothetical protein
MKFLTLFIFILISKFITAQTVIGPIGASAWSVGGNSVAEKNVFGVNNNMAATADLNSFNIGIYNQTPFAIKQLNTINASVIIPSKLLNIGFLVNNFGYEKFNQQNLGVGISKKLNNNFNLGITLNYLTINVYGQENTSALTGSVSTFYKINKNIQLGVLLFNPIESKYNINGYGNVNTFGRIGAKYQLSKSVFLISEIDKTIQYETILRGGINYAIHPKFNVSLGYANNPNLITCGFNANVKQLEITFATSIHETLGLTPHIGLVFYGK